MLCHWSSDEWFGGRGHPESHTFFSYSVKVCVYIYIYIQKYKNYLNNTATLVMGYLEIYNNEC